MIRVAVVEDEAVHADRLIACLRRYGRENDLAFSAARFSDAISFLETYRGGFDLVFLDIRMPGIDGIEAAKRLRGIDAAVQLIFVTSLVRYAVDGYAVGAADYIVKPFSYEVFALKLFRILRQMPDRDRKISFRFGAVYHRFSESDIRYGIVEEHNIRYRLQKESVLRRMTLNDALAELDERFCRIHSGCFVNLDYVEGFNGETVTVAGETLPVSRNWKSALSERLSAQGERL